MTKKVAKTKVVMWWAMVASDTGDILEVFPWRSKRLALAMWRKGPYSIGEGERLVQVEVREARG